jgi:hypothetical protein
MTIRLEGGELFQADGQTDMPKQVDALYNSAIARKKNFHCIYLSNKIVDIFILFIIWCVTLITDSNNFSPAQILSLLTQRHTPSSATHVIICV